MIEPVWPDENGIVLARGYLETQMDLAELPRSRLDEIAREIAHIFNMQPKP